MKRIEDIEIMTEKELEQAAMQDSALIPEGFRARLETALAAAKIAEEPAARPKGASRWIALSAVAAAAAVLAIVAIPRSGSVQLKDTFDDPVQAYAKVEETFRQISQKMTLGVAMASEAEAEAGKPIEIMNKINKK